MGDVKRLLAARLMRLGPETCQAMYRRDPIPLMLPARLYYDAKSAGVLPANARAVEPPPPADTDASRNCDLNEVATGHPKQA